MMRKLFAIIFIFSLLSNNVIAIEADIFVQSTVNRASKLLSENISKEEKIKKLELIAKDTVDIKRIDFYTIGSEFTSRTRFRTLLPAVDPKLTLGLGGISVNIPPKFPANYSCWRGSTPRIPTGRFWRNFSENFGGNVAQISSHPFRQNFPVGVWGWSPQRPGGVWGGGSPPSLSNRPQNFRKISEKITTTYSCHYSEPPVTSQSQCQSSNLSRL